MKRKLGSPEAMRHEPSLEHPDYFPPKRTHWEEDTWDDDYSLRCFCDAWHDGDYAWLRSFFS